MNDQENSQPVEAVALPGASSPSAPVSGPAEPQEQQLRIKQLKKEIEQRFAEIEAIRRRLGIERPSRPATPIVAPSADVSREEQLAWLAKAIRETYRLRRQLGMPEDRLAEAERQRGSIFGYRHGFRDGARVAIAALLSYGLSLTDLRNWMTAVVAWSLSANPHKTPAPKIPEQPCEPSRGL